MLSTEKRSKEKEETWKKKEKSDNEKAVDVSLKEKRNKTERI